MKEIIIALVLMALLIGGMMFFTRDDDERNIVEETDGVNVVEEVVEQEEVLGSQDAPSDEFIQCLVDSDMVVYASKTCPACTDFANTFGGYDAVENLFVLCGEQQDVCQEKMQTGYVPEIQFEGEVFQGDRSLQALSELTNCEL